MRSTFGGRLPGLTPMHLRRGHLLVLEGPDGSGRTTEATLLKEWLEVRGHPVVDTGLRRSTLVSRIIDRAKEGHTFGRTTMALLYAADFADQLENKILPSLASGATVLADRYVYTLIARAVVRGASRPWADRLYSFALVPDLTIYLDARPDILLHRAIAKFGFLDYWESGMDLSLSPDRFESFLTYQKSLRDQFEQMARQYGFRRVDANRTPEAVHRDVRRIVQEWFTQQLRRPARPERIDDAAIGSTSRGR